jgi:flagellar biosynthesis protein FliP
MRTTSNSPTLVTSNSYVTSTLRKDFQVPFVIYIPNTLVGCTNVNSIELIKSKGDSAFP